MTTRAKKPSAKKPSAKKQGTRTRTRRRPTEAKMTATVPNEKDAAAPAGASEKVTPLPVAPAEGGSAFHPVTAAPPPPPDPADVTPPELAPPPTVPDDQPVGEWGRIEPSDKRMGLVRLTLDRGVKTTVVGQVYGLDFEIEGVGHDVRIFFDYYSKRLKVLDYEATDYAAMTHRLEWLAEANDFDKVFLKASKDDWQIFLTFGYVLEGILKYYFNGEDAYVMSKFRSVGRINSPHLIEESDLIETLMRDDREYVAPPLPENYTLTLATRDHIPGLVALYRRVFETYPSPLTHPDYILQTMERNVVYRVIMNGEGDIVSAASAEIDEKHKNAEMTDCATNTSERGKGLMFHILHHLEDDLRERGVTTAYTLARAQSKGMNRVFYRLGYEFSGRLVNNCDIYGEYEDMNIWVKRLPRT